MGKQKGVKRFYRALRVPFEWIGIRLALWIIPSLSLPALLRLSRFIAAVGYFFDLPGRKVSAANLEVICGRKLSPRRIRILTKGAYRNMTRVLLMIFWTTRNPKEKNLQYVSIAPDVRKFLEEHRPTITLSAHLGNWEILSQTCESNGFHITSVAKPVKGKGMTELLTRARSTIGQTIIPADGALRGLMKALKQGSYIGLLVDQHTEIRDGGIWVDFFGLKSCISQGPAMLAKRFHTPMLFSWSRPLKDGSYRCEMGEVFLPDEGANDIPARTQAIIRSFERVIRMHPSLWCINYKRWRYLIPGEDPARYPFYARPAKPKQYGK